MNQILLTNNENNKKKNNANNYKSSANDIKKIIIFFSVIILIFGIAIGVIYGYKIYKNSKTEEKVIDKPKLSIEETETELTIIAESEIGINKIIYTWNDEEPEEVEMNGRTKLEKKLEIPNGESSLTVKAIDQSGQENETSKTFSREDNTEKPEINISILEKTAKLKIVATDENAMKYITYKWNEEEEVTVNVENETDTTIETTIDVKRGENSIVITAVDVDGNTDTVEKILQGVNKPIIELTRGEGEEKNTVYMKISHDMGLKKIEFSVNEKKYVYDENYPGYDANKTVVEYKFELQPGETKIIIIAVSNEGEQSTETHKGKCTYIEE